MLAQVALISFSLLALMAIVVDVGLVRVTQAQMQTAADAAALDGLRYRDGALDPVTAQPVIHAFANDCIRRTAAQRAVRSVFDDDMDEATEDQRQFGAGPIIDLTEGATSLHAHATMSVPELRTYKPTLQLNQPNATDGDMVSGRFCYSDDPARSEDAGYGLSGTLVCTEIQRGEGAYARNDFNPSGTTLQAPPELPNCPPADQPPAAWPRSGATPLNNAADSAFLVRLRRSNEYREFSGQTDPEVASSGPSLPLLFGRGAPIHGDDPASTYSVRRDGFTVRATAIAAARPAMRVGLPVPQRNEPGVTPFVLADTFAGPLPAAGAAVTINPANGLICAGQTCTATTPAIGRFIDTLTDPTRSRWTRVTTVGQALPASFAVSCAAASPRSGFGPVYSAMSSGGSRIIGFVPISLRRDPARPADPCAAIVSRGPSVIATSNASALVSGTFALPVGAEPADIRELLDKHFARPGRVAYRPLLAPVLVR